MQSDKLPFISKGSLLKIGEGYVLVDQPLAKGGSACVYREAGKRVVVRVTDAKDLPGVRRMAQLQNLARRKGVPVPAVWGYALSPVRQTEAEVTALVLDYVAGVGLLEAFEQWKHPWIWRWSRLPAFLGGRLARRHILRRAFEDLIRPFFAATHSLHRAGLVHGDLDHGANAKWESREQLWRVVLLDLGSARRIGQPGQIPGKVGFTPPFGSYTTADVRIDIYAAAEVLDRLMLEVYRGHLHEIEALRLSLRRHRHYHHGLPVWASIPSFDRALESLLAPPKKLVTTFATAITCVLGLVCLGLFLWIMSRLPLLL